MVLTDHYYTRRPETASREGKISVRLRGQDMTFYTDRGVFSKGRIDTGTAFLIAALHIPLQSKILDMGCGYGPVGLTLAKENPGHDVYMVDVNLRALDLARKNARENGVRNVHFLESNLFGSVGERDFEHIITNPPIRAGKQTVYQLFAESYDHLVTGGSLWVVIRKKQGALSAAGKLAERFNVQEIGRHKGYRVYQAQKIESSADIGC